MNTSAVAAPPSEPELCGLRMSAKQFLALPEDRFWYELVDGVVIVSPSPTPIHQLVTAEIVWQLQDFLRKQPVGRLFFEIDVHLGRSRRSGDLVYRPEIVFFTSKQVAALKGKSHLAGAPALVVEVISPSTRRLDTETKKNDYKAAGVREYWLVDPADESLIFYRLEKGRFAEVKPRGNVLTSAAVPGFKLDVAAIRQVFRSW